MAKNKGFIAEFKKFALRGNVMDMAVGIIVGAAFTGIVTSLVGDVITPLLSIILGSIDFSNLAWNVSSTLGIVTKTPIILGYGKFLQACLNFFLVAFSIFLLIKGINSLHKKEEVEEEAPAPPSEDVVLLTEIRDLLKK